MKILLTGASSYIGTYLCKRLSNEIQKHSDLEVMGIYHTNPVAFGNIKYICLDLTDFNSLKKLFNEYKPDTVIHLASVTQAQSPKFTEPYIELVNHGSTDFIAALCNNIGSLLIYTSTDLVYGENENITEESGLNPLTIYAKTKLNGEESIKMFSSKYIILRTSLVYGHTISAYRTFFDNVYDSLSKGKNYYAFSDQYRCPIYVEDVVDNFLNLLGYKGDSLTVNFCGNECLSRLEMCEEIADVFGFDKKLIIPMSCDTFKEHSMVKKLGLKNDRMKELGLTANTFRVNLFKIKNTQRKLD